MNTIRQIHMTKAETTRISDPRTMKYAHKHLALRRTIGWIGILLPISIALGNALIFHESHLCHSISRYYYTGMRDVFVGGLFAMALFMFFHCGYDRWESRAGNVAGVCILGVCLFPVAEEGAPWGLSGTLHYVFALGLFATLAAFSLFLFSRTQDPSNQKEHRKSVIHIACGLVIVSCIIAILVHSSGPSCDLSRCSFVLAAEVVALTAFALSWQLEAREVAAAARAKLAVAA